MDGVFFAMMLEKSQSETKKNLEYYILYYTYHNLNIPFDCRTICFAISGLGYQKNYVAMTLSRLKKMRYISEPKLGIYLMNEENFEIIKTTNPEFAKELKLKLVYDKTVSCQKSTCMEYLH